MKLSVGTFALLFTTISQVFVSGYRCDYHVVLRKGDTCDDLGDDINGGKINIRYDDIFHYNPYINCDKLKVGSLVCVDSDPDHFYAGTKKHKIVEGDSYDGIAKKYGTTKEVLYYLNGSAFYYKDGDKYIKNKIGNKITYRVKKDYAPDFTNSKEVQLDKHVLKSNEFACEKHVVVKRGDTCSKICKSKNVNINLKQLKSFNPTMNCDNLRTKSKICVLSYRDDGKKVPNFKFSTRISI